MGWASNYAQIFDAIRAFDANRPDYIDELWGVPLPNPLPAAGAKVKLSGVYSTRFSMSSSGGETDTDMGLLTYERLATVEAAPEPTTLPGVRRVPKQ
jgi:hypothetical protein